MTDKILNKNPLGLIIEDDDDAAAIVDEALQLAGYDTEVIQDGKTAMTRLAIIKPAIVTLDLHLPHISGTNILHQIRTDERLAETRVMLVTADPRLAETVREEADLVLLKPVTFSQLHDLAARLRPQDAQN